MLKIIDLLSRLPLLSLAKYQFKASLYYILNLGKEMVDQIWQTNFLMQPRTLWILKLAFVEIRTKQAYNTTMEQLDSLCQRT